ncbi:hypothetical protein RB195_006780 [Necator americanus]|uniref:Uncharacterized protein n=1 Tax=Necator americanus TaxID=51031 RepID=A0ABR1BXV3_NECAM
MNANSSICRVTCEKIALVPSRLQAEFPMMRPFRTTFLGIIISFDLARLAVSSGAGSHQPQMLGYLLFHRDNCKNWSQLVSHSGISTLCAVSSAQ